VSAPLVYAVTLAWNRCGDTLECVASLGQSSYRPLRILVCDNGSTDGTSAAVHSAFPQVEVLELRQNLGFAAGANRGLRHAFAAGADHVLLINNDTTVDPLMIEHLVAATAPDAGIVAPLIYYALAPSTIWSAGGLRSRWTLEQTGDLRGRHDWGDWPPTLARDFVTGCAMLIPRGVLETVGLLDERFFMYYEDNDFCLRIRRAGYRILLVPGAKMWHKVALSSGGIDSPAERYAMARSSVLFFRKHVAGWQWAIVGPFRLGSAARTTLRLLRRWSTAAIVAYWSGLGAGWSS
jgi:GT2 family glycosyltransferase